MNRFLVPALVAAAVHGVVLGWPRTEISTAQSGETPPVRPCDGFILVRDEDPVTVESTGANGGGSSGERPSGLEPPTVEPRDGIVIDVPREPVTHFKPGVTVIEGTGRGLLGDGVVGVGGPMVVKRDALDHAPRTRLQVPPEYPSRAKESGLDGEVVVEFVVNEAGRVMSPIIASSSDSIFDEAAIRAVLRWRFEPGTVSGRPVRFRMAVPIVFRLER